MPTEILMPALSPTMEEGKLTRWLIKEGQAVKAGDVIAEIETDKATMEVEAVDEGKVGKILVAEGTEGVKVNTPIAVLVDADESAGTVPAGKPQAPKAKAQTPDASEPTAPAPKAAPPKAQPPKETPPAAAAKGANGAARILVSPLARRLAREAGLDLAALAGSGPHGRIVKSDVEAAAREGAGPAPKAGTAVMSTRPAPAPTTPPAMADAQILALYETGSYDVVPHDNMRKVIARRLTQSKQTIPHYRLSVDCRLDDLLKARERMNAAAPKNGPRAYKLSVNDFVIKALALALVQVPDANVTWTEGGTLRHKYADIGVAVAIEGGLFTPLIRHAELKSLSRSPTRCATSPSAPASGASPRTSIRAAPRRSPTSACTASRASTR